MNREFLKELLLTPSVSGHEEEAQRKALAYGQSFAQGQLCDPSGNAISVVNPESACKVLLCGHIDEIGFIVTHIQSDGMLRLAKAGGVRAGLYVGTPVQILHEGQKVDGVVAVASSLIKKGDVAVEDLMVDIGAETREQALEHVAVGDPVCADTQVHELLNDRFSSRGLDDRTGAFVILEAAKRAAQKGAQAGIYAATTVGEETTMRGAYYAASRVRPSCAIVVDVTWVSDAPETNPAHTGEVGLGKGPVLCMSSVVNKKMNRLFKQIAQEKEIPVQWELAPAGTSTDGDKVNLSGEGVPVALVSIPLRYMHSSVEIASWSDLENCIELISEFLLRIEEGFDYCPLS
ncbi:MAG: M42 family metallopeptidase [Lachnospiraceae bacterium]|jgi:putative aminopeptidase FrvX|nr:M42 family metallopeptidase [Lachnospiraceae bacterium]